MKGGETLAEAPLFGVPPSVLLRGVSSPLVANCTGLWRTLRAIVPGYPDIQKNRELRYGLVYLVS